MSRAAHALLGLLIAACTGDEAGVVRSEPSPLLDPEAMRPVSADADPMVQHRPIAVSCSEGAWGPEAGGFEVQTGVCDYAAFAQPLGVELEPGDRVDIRIWHDTLDAAEAGTGHVAVLLGEHILWEQIVDIPTASAELGAIVEVSNSVPTDTPLGLHLHNHGYNSWRFFAVDLLD